MYQHIVIAVDGSRTSQHALKQACGLAKATGAALTLVHVANPAEYVATVAPEFLQYENYEAAATEQGNAILDAAIKQARADLGENAKIGAVSVVVADVPSSITVVGVPAKPVGRSSKTPSADMDQSIQLSTTDFVI